MAPFSFAFYMRAIIFSQVDRGVLNMSRSING